MNEKAKEVRRRLPYILGLEEDRDTTTFRTEEFEVVISAEQMQWISISDLIDMVNARFHEQINKRAEEVVRGTPINFLIGGATSVSFYVGGARVMIPLKVFANRTLDDSIDYVHNTLRERAGVTETDLWAIDKRTNRLQKARREAEWLLK